MAVRPNTSGSPPTSISNDPPPAPINLDNALLVLTGLLLLGPLPAGVWHLWCRWTIAEEISLALDWLGKAAKNFDDAKEFWERHGEFELTDDAKRCLRVFSEEHSRCNNVMKDELCRYEASWTMYPWSSGNRAKLHRDREMLKSLKGKVECLLRDVGDWSRDRANDDVVARDPDDEIEPKSTDDARRPPAAGPSSG